MSIDFSLEFGKKIGIMMIVTLRLQCLSNSDRLLNIWRHHPITFQAIKKRFPHTDHQTRLAVGCCQIWSLRRPTKPEKGAGHQKTLPGYGPPNLRVPAIRKCFPATAHRT